MELLANLQLGLAEALTLTNILYALLGVTLGTLVGVLPGVGPSAVISILLPLTFNLGDATTSLIMLAGIFYGTQYGGSTTAILLKIPGEISTLVTALDGHEIARKGRAGSALAIAALSSFFAGTVATFIVAGLAIPLTELGFKFGPAEYANLMVLGLILSVSLTQNSFAKGLAMILTGILFGLVGTDSNTGDTRFTFDVLNLASGFSFPIVAIGVFGLSEILYTMFHLRNNHRIIQNDLSFKEMLPTKHEFKKSAPAAVRGTFIGSLLGIIPGPGTVIGSVASYVLEKKWSKHPERFGKGEFEGLAGPEAANNAASQTSLIPMLTLGLPFSPIPALLLGAMILNNVVPGPMVIETNPELFWGVIAAMWISNIMLLVLNLPLIKIWIKIISIPWKILYPSIFILTAIGSYSISNNIFDIYSLIFFSILGYLFKVWNCEPAPFVVGFILGPFLEEYSRRALILNSDNWAIFINSGISQVLVGITAIILMFKCYIFIKSLKI